MAIKWARIKQPRFNRVVEALVHRMYDATATVRALDGRGGDGGIDIDVVQGGRLRIFQLKYYPDGFPTSARGRRRSVENSFKRAMEHDPYEWTLVVPCNLTASEDAFVRDLGAGRSVKISVLGVAALDSRLAAHPDLAAYFTRKELRQAARDYNQEKAFLLDPQHLPERIQALGQMGEQLDPHWAPGFTWYDGELVSTVYPKHPRAYEVSPITIRLDGHWRPDDTHLRTAFIRSIGYGLPEPLTLPPEVVESLSIEGPAWLARTDQHVEVSWVPVRCEPVDIKGELVFFDEGGDRRVSYQAVVEHHGAGPQGRSLVLRLFGLVVVQVMLPSNDTAPVDLEVSTDIAGADTTAALLAFGLDGHLHTPGRFEIHFDGDRFLGARTYPPRPTDEAELVARLHEMVKDLARLQDYCGQYFPVPSRTTAQERIDLRIARLLIEGACVIDPSVRIITMTLNGTDGPGLRGMLAPGPQGLRVVHSAYELEFAGHSLPLGQISMFHTQVSAQNREAVLQALDSGTASGEALSLVPIGEQCFRLYKPELRTDDSDVLTPIPLALPGLPEPR
ncbi:hypothetical protein [Streptacidiphilus sp. PAMC 29251]